MEQIITMLKKSIEETGLNISDETLFSEAVKIYVSMGIQKGYKDNTTKPEIIQQKPQEQESKAVNPITPGQYKALCLLSKDIEGEEYLKSKGIKSEKDIEKLSKKEAWQIMHNRGN